MILNPILAAYHRHSEEIMEAISRVLESGQYILGSEVKSFEREFADYINTRYAVGVGNGTDALELSLRACNIGPGDEVIVPAHTAVATVAAIEASGATPLLVDISPDTYTINTALIPDAITPRTRAILPVHLFGLPADMDDIVSIARAHSLHVIEDCAQSHGAAIRGRKTGSMGDVGAFSFYPTKNLGALGDGGMIVTKDREIAEKVLLLRQYGWEQRNSSRIPGFNSRLDEIQAAILRVKLQYLDGENKKRRQMAHVYLSELTDEEIVFPRESDDTFHVYHQFVIRLQLRDSLREYLNGCGIPTAIHYPFPIHLQPAYYGRLGHKGTFPITESVCSQVLSLPMHPYLENEDVTLVCDSIRKFTETVEQIDGPS